MSMLNTTIANDSKFGQKLTGFKNSSGSIRDGVQEMLAYGLVKYRDDGDSGALTRLYRAAVEAKGVKVASIKEYITAHADLKLTRDQNKNPKFVKATPKGEPRTVVEPDAAWYNFQKSNGGEKDKTVHVKRRLDAISAAINKAAEDGNPIDMDGAAEAVAQLQATIAAHEGVAKAQAEDFEPAH